MTSRASELRLYSVGIAAQNLPLNTDILEVFCQEDHPMADGEITENANTYKASGDSSEQGSVSAEIETTITISAKWIPIGDANRQTPPNVRRGAKLHIYTYGDSKQYFWVTADNDLSKRKLETVVYAFSATKEEGASISGDNCYFLEISTHKGLVRLITSKANGEPFRIGLTLNTKDGSLIYQDDNELQFLLDSALRRLYFQNADGSKIDVTQKTGLFYFPDKASFETKEWDVKASTGKMSFDTLEIAAETTHKGNLGLQGSLQASSGGARSGGAAGAASAIFNYPVKFRQGIEVEGNCSVTGVLHAQRVISDQAIQAPNV